MKVWECINVLDGGLRLKHKHHYIFVPFGKIITEYTFRSGMIPDYEYRKKKHDIEYEEGMLRAHSLFNVGNQFTIHLGRLVRVK